MCFGYTYTVKLVIRDCSNDQKIVHLHIWVSEKSGILIPVISREDNLTGRFDCIQNKVPEITASAHALQQYKFILAAIRDSAE